jgi:hypothetical protein
MNREHLDQLLHQALETELNGEQVYVTAISCAVDDDLRKEWEKYLDETRDHHRILRDVFAVAGLDPVEETPGRAVVRYKAQALIAAMEMAKSDATPEEAQLVAAECVVEAETKDHQNWGLINRASKTVEGPLRSALSKAFEQVGEQEAEHLFHTQGWARELWIDYLGMEAAIPPPEEQKKVKTKIGAGRAEHDRQDYTG